MGVSKEISGLVFGKLTAVRRVRRTVKRESMWLCMCECGVECEVRLSNLMNKNTKYCGCMNGRKT